MFNNLILSSIIFINFNSYVFSQSGWVQQSRGVTSKLLSVYFINSSTGWASGDSGVVIKTTNGGTNWIIQNSTTNLPLLTIMFSGTNTGWAAGGFDDNNPLCFHNVMLIKTTNGGNNWTQLSSGIGFLYNDLFVVNNQTLYITNSGICCPPFCISEAGGLNSTTNSGQNWFGSLNLPSHSVYFININSGWASSRTSSDVLPSRNYIHRTTNAGNNWELMYSDSTDYTPFKNIFFTDGFTGYVKRYSLLKSTNAGMNWQRTDSINTIGISNHFFINNDTGWCSGGFGKIIRTNNGGTNWNFQSTNTTSSINSVYFVDAYSGWAVGNNGTIIKTITGGLTSGNTELTQINSFKLYQNYPNPFNPKTIISYTVVLPFSKGAKEVVSLKVYDILGNEVSTLVNEKQNPGSYSVEFDSRLSAK